jgi:hypothetical protein
MVIFRRSLAKEFPEYSDELCLESEVDEHEKGNAGDQELKNIAPCAWVYILC